MYIIGSNNDILNIKKHNTFGNIDVKFSEITDTFLSDCLHSMKLGKIIFVNHKKSNMLLAEICKKLLIFKNTKESFLLILRGIILHNNGPNLFLYPTSKSCISLIKECLYKCRKIREVSYVLYSRDGYIVSGKFYKNKLIIKSDFTDFKNIQSNEQSNDIKTFDSTHKILSSFNMTMSRYSGDFLIDYKVSGICSMVQEHIKNCL